MSIEDDIIVKQTAKPAGPAQEPQVYNSQKKHIAGAGANQLVPATPAPSQPASLLDAVEQLRAIPAAWKERPDPLAELHEIRHGSQPAGPAQEPQQACKNCGVAIYLRSDKTWAHADSWIASCRHNAEPVPATPAPSQPAGAREFIESRQFALEAFMHWLAGQCEEYARQQTAAKDAALVAAERERDSLREALERITELPHYEASKIADAALKAGKDGQR